MAESFSESYKAAGVDVTAGYQAVELMKSHVESTRIPGVLSGIGGFGGLFQPDLSGMHEPVFVSGTDGVGTKLRIAFLCDRHDTVGIDCVAMCVNDIVCAGAKPLFFLDYLAVGKNIPEKVAAIVSGIAEGCRQSDCALVGGETAEMPGFYPEDEYDLAGFSVGMVDKARILNSENVCAGDAVIGIASSGVHSNGFSLVRKVFSIEEKGLNRYADTLGHTLGEELLTPTRIYVRAILTLLSSVSVHAVSHITGGGFYENIPRALPQGLGVRIRKSALEIPPIFALLQEVGQVPERDMFNTFNMGTGMCVMVAPDKADEAVRVLTQCGEKAQIIGEVSAGCAGVVLA